MVHNVSDEESVELVEFVEMPLGEKVNLKGLGPSEGLVAYCAMVDFVGLHFGDVSSTAQGSGLWLRRSYTLSDGVESLLVTCGVLVSFERAGGRERPVTLYAKVFE